MEEQLSWLRRAALFESLSDADLMPFARGAYKQEYPARQLLFSAGDVAHHFFLVLHGMVRLYRLTNEGKEKVIELIRAGETFAEAVVFLQRPYPVYAETVEASQIVRIPSSVILHEIEHCPALSLKLLASLSRRLHSFIEDIHALSLENAQQRVAGFLLAMVEQESSDFPVSKSVIASRLGLTPESFSRAFGRLKAAGLVLENEGQIQVVNLQQLRLLRQGTE